MLIVGFIPWSIFLGLTVWNTVVELHGARHTENPNQSAVRFLTCCVGVYFVFFSLAGTKLPNYILPLYPAVAVLMARLLDRYRGGEIRVAPWAMRLSVVCLGLIGIGLALGLFIVGGALPLGMLHGRSLPGVEWLAVVGVVPLAGACLAGWYASQERRLRLTGVIGATAVLTTAALAMWGPLLADRSKAPRELVALLPAGQTLRDVRVATFDYFQPSLVFYCQREVETFTGEQQVQDFLDGPLPSYLILPVEDWEALRPKLHARCHALGSKYDIYEGREIFVVTNEPSPLAAALPAR
jgi:4-amino-4-deoxy-L-arabinose transferase-like glycosyltransferase